MAKTKYGKHRKILVVNAKACDVLTETMALLLTFMLNIPFGYWRSKTRRMSKEWFLAIHLPVPLIIVLRILAQASWIHVPLFLLAFFLGQFSGGRIGALRSLTKHQK